MIKALQDRIYWYRAYYGRAPRRLAITKEQRDLLIEELKSTGSYMYVSARPDSAPKEDLFMGIPLDTVEVINARRIH